MDGAGGVDGLGGAAEVVVHPGGRWVVAAGAFDNALAIFARDPASGELEFAGRFHDSQGDGLSGVVDLAFSPDGAHLYTAAFNEDEVGVFSFDTASGAVGFVGVVAEGVDGVSGILHPAAVALSLDGVRLYAGGMGSDSVAVFARDPGSGALTFLEAHFGGVGGVGGLAGVNGLGLSPDGDHLYAASSLDDSLAVFARQGDGTLAFVEAVRDGLGGVDGLDEADAVAVSPDGSWVVAAGQPGPVGGDDWIAVFSRSPATGVLGFLAALPNPVPGTVVGCGGGPTDPAARLAFSPDGSRLWATNAAHRAVVALELADDGTPNLLELTCNGVDGATGLQAASGVAVTADGRHLYATGLFDHALAAFATRHLFADGFESGDTATWSAAVD